MSDTGSQIAAGAAHLLGGAAQGFMTGGPMGALLGAITGILPDIGVHLFGSAGPAVQAAAQAAAAAVTGVPSPTAADVSGLAPDKTAELRVRLAEIAAQAQKDKDAAATAQMNLALASMQASLADTAGARDQTAKLASLGSKIAYGAPVVSVVVLVTFGVVMAIAFTRALPDGSQTILTMLLGSLAAMATSVVSYWVGSSAGSQRKDASLADSVPSAAVTGMIEAAQAGGAPARPLAP